MAKSTKRNASASTKTTVRLPQSTDHKRIVWVYDKIDRSGKFAFDLNRIDFDHKEFLDKMINYSNATWTDVKKQTHDNNKSKHHFIAFDELSKDAQKRFESLKLEEYSDSIFSFAFRNKLRILGIRENENFHVLWYDPNHEACPSSKKNT